MSSLVGGHVNGDIALLLCMLNICVGMKKGEEEEK